MSHIGRGRNGERRAPVTGLVLAAPANAATKKKPAPKAAAAAPVSQPTDTSKRFNMTQDGKKMTADDFDAWMKKNGYRVATGKPAAEAEAPKK